MRKSGVVAGLVLLFSAAFSQPSKEDLTRFVDPFLGAGGHGHTYPGATVPFGMVQLSPDNGRVGWDWCSGYHYSDSMIVGFSHTHLSGTGCADLGDIGVMPGTSVQQLEDAHGSRFSHARESAVPGYYRVTLDGSDILVELTATDHVGFHRYTFPKEDTVALMVNLLRGQEDNAVDTHIALVSPTQITGYRFSNGWAPDQRIFFSAKFSRPFFRALLADSGMTYRAATSARGDGVRGIFEFEPSAKGEPLMVKVGVSSSSEAEAEKNLEAEVPSWDFDGVRAAAHDAWEKELEKVKIETPDEQTKTVFYSAMYHAFLAPTEFSDVDGTYRGGDGKIHVAKGFKYYSTYSLWDTYRAAHPLYTILQPERVDGLMQCMIAFAKESGYLPVWQLAANETNCMVGYHAVPPLVDAYLKGFRGFDAKAALAAMEKTSTRDHRGLRYYSIDAPEPVLERLADERKAQAGNEIAAGSVVLSGYASRVSGDTIDYHSNDPTVNRAVIARASDGMHPIEWMTADVPSNVGDSTRTFVWMGGVGSAKGAHAFVLSVDGDSVLTFHSAVSSADRSLSGSGKHGSRLSFTAQSVDDFGDLFGDFILSLPAEMAPAGRALRLRLSGENAQSGDWVMTFEHPLSECARASNAYGLVHRNGIAMQLVRIDVEHLGASTSAMLGAGKLAPMKVGLVPGQSVLYLPLPQVAKQTPLTVRLEESKGPVLVSDVAVRPMQLVGYVPADKDRESVSKSLEYAIDDFSISTFAGAMGDKSVAEMYRRRAEDYRNLFDPSTGFFRGRKLDGSWVTPFNPRFSTEKQPEYTEGNAWQYLWLVPQDVKGLMSLLGGRAKFDVKLDSLFSQSSDLNDTGAPPDESGLVGLYAQGNEPSHHIAYLYDYDGNPWKTQQLVHHIMTEFYKTGVAGLCGNEDCGQMSAWYLFSALGFYPVTPIGGVYVLGSPMVSHAVINVGHGKTFTIDAKNLSMENYYIQSASLDGKPLDRPWFTHADLLRGGTLTLEMGASPNKQWGSDPTAMPPTLPPQ